MHRARSFCLPLLVLLLVACDSRPTGPVRIEDTVFAPELGIDLSAMTQTGTGLYRQDLVIGTGAQAGSGSFVRVFYTGWLPDGRQFDSNIGGEPLPFTIGPGGVIAGFAEGVRGMRVGGKRRLLIPPFLGYGDRPPAGSIIPPNSVLVFEVELVSVQ